MRGNANTNKRTVYRDNGIESLREGAGRELKNLGTSALDEFFKNFLKNTAEGIPKQALGTEKSTKKSEGILSEGQEIYLQKEEKTVTKQENRVMESQKRFALHREYFRRDVESSTEKTKHEENSVTVARIQEVQTEIRKLITASQEMETAFKQVSTQVKTQTVHRPSQYEVSFFEWVLITIKNARARIEEGQNWLSLFASKKSQKQYWNMAGKHGNNFTLSNERSVVTQTG